MERLIKTLSAIERRLVARRADVASLSDHVELLRKLGVECIDVELAAEIAEIEICRLSRHRAVLTRVLHSMQSKKRVVARSSGFQV